MRIVKYGRGEWKIGVLRKNLDPRELTLTFLGTGKLESGGGVRKLKRNEQPLFRGESPGFVNPACAKLTSSHYS
jgi:hypothetical protein